MPSRSRPFWGKTASLTTTPSVILLPDGWRELKVAVDALCYGQVGATYAAPAVASVNGVYTIDTPGSPSSGNFQLRAYPGEPDQFDTADIAYNASAATIKTKLTDTGKFASGDISAGGGALPTAVTLTFQGSFAGSLPPLIVVDSTLVGGSPRIQKTTLPLGNGGYGYLPANTQEAWTAGDAERVERFLYLATVASTGTAYITAYR